MVENAIQIKSGITINVDVSVKISKNIMFARKDYISNTATCSCENSKYLGIVIDNSLIMSDEIPAQSKPDQTRAVPTNFNSKNVTCKTKIV